MPQYNGSGTGSTTPNTVLPAALLPGDSAYLFGTSVAAGTPPAPGQIAQPNDANVIGEIVTAGEASIAVNLARLPNAAPAGAAVQIIASANPGVCEIDIQNAHIDADGAYLTPTNTTYQITTWTATGTGTYTAWAEFQAEGGTFMRLKCISNPNAVTFIAKVLNV